MFLKGFLSCGCVNGDIMRKLYERSRPKFHKICLKRLILLEKCLLRKNNLGTSHVKFTLYGILAGNHFLVSTFILIHS